MPSDVERIEQLGQSLAGLDTFLAQADEDVAKCAARQRGIEDRIEAAQERLASIRNLVAELGDSSGAHESDWDSVRRRLVDLARTASSAAREASSEESPWNQPPGHPAPVVVAELVETEPEPSSDAMVNTLMRFLGEQER